jgi:hypothetical protein
VQNIKVRLPGNGILKVEIDPETCGIVVCKISFPKKSILMIEDHVVNTFINTNCARVHTHTHTHSIENLY